VIENKEQRTKNKRLANREPRTENREQRTDFSGRVVLFSPCGAKKEPT
jgi:hypothetical protein